VGPAHWLRLAAIVLVTGLLVTWVRRRAEGTVTGRVFFARASTRWGITALAVVAAVAVLAPLVTAYVPSAQLDVIQLQNRPPSLLHPLGTDVYSRDVWSRLVYGARVSLAVGSLGMLVAIIVGSAVGAAAGFIRGALDAALMFGVDVGLSVPRIFVLLLVAGLWERIPLPVFVLAIGLTSWFATSRLVRAEVLSVRERGYVAAARAAGAGPARLVLRHVLPNAAAPIIVTAALGVGGVMLLEAGLSFLGFGVAPPLPSWGNMIADARDHVRAAPWTAVAPGLAIALVVMACNAVGDALREALDPRAVDRARERAPRSTWTWLQHPSSQRSGAGTGDS
jgi:peptide/nickel transport system permease protein